MCSFTVWFRIPTLLHHTGEVTTGNHRFHAQHQHNRGQRNGATLRMHSRLFWCLPWSATNAHHTCIAIIRTDRVCRETSCVIFHFSLYYYFAISWEFAYLMKKQTSSLKIGVNRSKKSLASSTITGSSVSSSKSWRVWNRNCVKNDSFPDWWRVGYGIGDQSEKTELESWFR